ncbi:MAG TPA: MaoC/PaaZ C-terminal domain-containing protein, partial [Caulobacteraceae bacterium]
PLLGGLSPADLLVSIGSAAEAARLRRHPSLAESGARLHAETPGSGAAVLGPDVDAASPEFALFVEAAERQPGRPRLVPRALLQDVRQSRAGDGASRLHVYDDLEAAATQLAIGSAAEFFSHEPATAIVFVARAAPRLARIAVVDRDTGPAEVSEGLIARLEPYLNRSVVQASPAVLGAIIDRHLPGAPITTGPEHPFRKRFGELALGYSLKTGARTITLEDIEHFAHFTGDTFYAHMDEEAAKASPIFGGRVAHGYLILAFAAGLFVDPPPGPVLANYGLDNLRFVKPMRPGDSLAVTLTVKSKTRRNAQMGEVRWGVTAVNQNGEVTATYDLLTMNAV